MLVLSRRRGENLQIGENTRVTVLEVSNGRVKIGIEAPDKVRVLRGELVAATPAQAESMMSPAQGCQVEGCPACAM